MLIYVECKPDKAFINTLLEIKKRTIRHGKGKSEIIKFVWKKNNILGIVDEDPGRPVPSCFEEFVLEKSWDFNIDLYRNKRKGNALIILKPKLEDWILSVAYNNGIHLNDFGLPETADELKKVINSNIEKFSCAVSKLKECKELKMLRDIILNEL